MLIHTVIIKESRVFDKIKIKNRIILFMKFIESFLLRT